MIHRLTIKCLIRPVIWYVVDQNLCLHHHLVHQKQCAVHTIHTLLAHLPLSINHHKTMEQLLRRITIVVGFYQVFWACSVVIQCHQPHPLHHHTLAKKVKMVWHHSQNHQQPVHQKLSKPNHLSFEKWILGYQHQCKQKKADYFAPNKAFNWSI